MNQSKQFNAVIKRFSLKKPKIQYIFEFTTSSAPTVRFFYQQSAVNSAKVDWGDGTTDLTNTNTATRQVLNHAYSSGGTQIIKIVLLTNINDFHTTSPSWDSRQCFLYVNVEGWKFDSVYVPDGVTALSQGMFNGHIGASTTVSIPDSITSIGGWAFYTCPLRDMPMPPSLQTIGQAAFFNDTTRTSVEFPASLTSIGEAAFRYSTGIASVTFNGLTPPTIGANAFGNINGSAKVYIPSGTLAAYQTAFAGTGLQNKTIIEV